MKRKNVFLNRRNHTTFKRDTVEEYNYITPEDCEKQAKKNLTAAMISFLEILGKQVPNMGIEDAGLCAFVIWQEVTK